MKDFNVVKKACFTGYRPDKFPFNLNNDNVDFAVLKSRIKTTLKALVEDDCKVFYSGMAMGFDIVCAEMVLELKETYNDIKLICAIPFKKQGDSLSYLWRKRYFDILNKCDEFSYISQDYSKTCYQLRNNYMVDNSDYVLTWYDGKFGGTRNTLDYAAEKGRYIFNVNGKGADSFGVQTSMEIL
jgi:uncharacterized phage-like protein YoqJ